MASCPRPRRVPTDHDSNPGPDAGLNIVRPSGIIIGGDAVPVVPTSRRTGIMYGRSGLDGCDGARHARSVTVSGQPGLLSVATDPEGSSRKWVQLIWPATLKHSDGVFGLFGWLSPRAVLAMAESMPVVGAPPVADAGC
jgi:hypothetical protein